MKYFILLSLLFIGVFCSLAQEFEIVYEYNDTIFSSIGLSKIHNDSLLFCIGYIPEPEPYDAYGVYKIKGDLAPELIWYFDTPERTYCSELLSYNDTLFYTLTHNRYEDNHMSYLESYVWQSDSCHPLRIDIDTLAIHPSSINYSITKHDSILYITGLQNSVPHYICSISNPLNPIIVNEISAFGEYSIVRNNLVIDSLLIMLGSWPNYLVYNLSNPIEPELVSNYLFSDLNPEWEACGVCSYQILGHYMIVHGLVGMTSGFYGVLDISNPVEPIPLNFHRTWDMVCFSRNNGNYILLTNTGPSSHYSEHQIFDFSNPTEPEILLSYPDSTTSERNTYLFLTSQLQDGIFYSEKNTFYEDSSTYSILTKFDISDILTRYYTIEIKRGWNLLSYPLFNKIAVSSISEDIEAYGYSNDIRNYEITDSLNPGQAFWVLSEHDTVIEYSECPNTYMLKKAIYPGWNMLGPTLMDLPVDRFSSNPSIIPPIYGYNTETGEYTATDTLKLLKGYWILSTDTTEITTWRQYNDEFYNY